MEQWQNVVVDDVLEMEVHRTAHFLISRLLLRSQA